MGIVFGATAFELAIGLSGIFWIIRQVIKPTSSWAVSLKNPVVVPWIVFWGCIVVSAVFNYRAPRELIENILFFRYPLCALALIDTSRRLPVQTYLLWGLGSGVVLAILNTLAAHLIGFDLIGRSLERYTGKLKEAARFSGLLAFATPFFLAWGLEKTQARLRDRVVLIALGLISAALVLQFDIRTVELAVLAGLVAVLAGFVKQRANVAWAISVLFLLAVSAAIYFYVYRPYLGSFYDRFHIWKVAATIWRENPIIGVSVTGYREAYRALMMSGPLSRFAVVAPDGIVYNGMVDGSIEITSHAHSLILMVLSTTGVLGLVAFVWLLGGVAKTIIKSKGSWRSGLLPWLVVLLVIGIAGFNIFDAWYTTLFVFFSALIALQQNGVIPADIDTMRHKCE